MRKARHLFGICALVLSAGLAPRSASAQDLVLNEAGYFETQGVNYLVFSNWYDGLFADAKISGVEIVQRDWRTVTNGDVRLSATPGQWDPIGRMIDRTVDPESGAIEVRLEYPGHDFRYRIRAERRPGGAIGVAVILDEPLPAALAGRAGFNLEFLPAAYFHRSFMADGIGGTFPLHPSATMVASGERLPSSGRDVGPGAEALPFASGRTIVFAPEDPARRVTVTSKGAPMNLYDGRNQAQNGWFVLRSELPSDRAGRVVEWTIRANGDPDWIRAPVIGHSQLGYAPAQAKVAVIELDPNDRPTGPARLLRVGADGTLTTVLEAEPEPWGRYLRYDYRRFDFGAVRDPGIYLLEYGGTRTATFRIAPDIYAEAWHPSMDVFLPVQMDHMFVNEAYRVWHGDPHRDDARQAPLDHEHIDLYRQGPTTDTRFAPGEHIPGLAVGGWLDAGDFDQRTQTQYAVVRSLVDIWERYRPERDTTWIDQQRRRVELHVPDGRPDILQQISHGTLQLAAQFDAVGHAVHGIVEPDVAQYTHLGDAGSKTDGLVYDPSLAPGEEQGGRSGTPDDRWAFTSRASALNFGSIAALAAASRALRGHDDRLAARSLEIARRVWTEEQSRPPFTFRHGNTTGGPLDTEEFTAAVELLIATGEREYADRIAALWPALADRFPTHAVLAVRAMPHMPASFRGQLETATRTYAAGAAERLRANPYGVPITEGGWAGNGAVIQAGLLDYALHKAFPQIVDGSAVFRALDYLHGTHPGHDLSFVSGVGTRSKEIAYGSNRADFSFIAGGVVPGVLIVRPDLPENSESWPFFWGENEYVVNMGPAYVALVHAAMDLLGEVRPE
ncbi:glycoside hydrolase family 9 protein [Sphingosinicella sp. CPCC 101087]|uniref:glycoside hydrolase family 9 protein n=1 Tax=Sphingosinicella sp. CPCC 101087 TaxID=2497754 RepID=UPI00101DD078|nr:glycoside hydrolase family 9 protein [Sphingosinicella sp. CPCC 101087]